MKYLEKELGKNEKLIYLSGVSWWLLAPHIFLSSVLVLVSLIITIFDSSIGGIFFLVSLALSFLVLFNPLIKKFTTEIAITDQRVMSKRGLFTTDVKSTPLGKVNNIRVIQNILGNMFNFGNIEITTATAEESDNHMVASLTKPDEFRNILSEELDKQTQGQSE